MRSILSPRTRRWVGASALAIIAGIGGGSAFVAATTVSSAQTATVVPAAQITAPAVTNAPNFADLVEAVKPAVTFSIASCWCGRGWCLAAGLSSTSSWSSAGQATCQSIGAAAISESPIRCTGIDCFLIVSSALPPQCSVVETMIRLENPSLPEAARKESMSALDT